MHNLIRLGLVGLVLTGTGCVTTATQRRINQPDTTISKPYARGGENYTLEQNFDLDEITENNSRYQVKGLEIFGEGYFVANTDLGEAMFRRDKSILEVIYEVGDTKARGTIPRKIKGEASRQSGEGGLYFLEPSRTKEGKLKNWGRINPSVSKTHVTPAKTIRRKGHLGIFHETERNFKSKIGVVTFSEKGPCYVIGVEDKEIQACNNDFYNFYAIPVDGARKRTNPKGEEIIWHNGKLFRPTFKSWADIQKEIHSLDAKEGFQKLGLRMEETGAGIPGVSNKKDTTIVKPDSSSISPALADTIEYFTPEDGQGMRHIWERDNKGYNFAEFREEIIKINNSKDFLYQYPWLKEGIKIRVPKRKK